MTNKTFQYVVAIGSLAVIAGIVIAVQSKKQKDEQKPTLRKEDLLTGLGESQTSNIFKDVDEATKMCLPLSLKNTCMSIGDFESLTELPPFSNPAINPFMNRDKPTYQYNPNKLNYPKNIREGLFYIQVGNTVLSRRTDGNLYMETNNSPANFDLQRREFDIDTKSATTVDKAIFMPIMLKYVPNQSGTSGTFDFYLKNFVGKFSGDKDGGDFTNIVPQNKRFRGDVFPQDKIFFLIHGTDGTMLHPQVSGDGAGLVRADQWTSWETNWRGWNRNEIKFIPTGDKDRSYYIQFVSNSGLFNAKDDNYVDFNGSIGSNRAKWLVEFSGQWQDGGVGAYKIKSVLKNEYITWSGQVGPSWVKLTPGGTWIGIYNKNNFGWGGYLFGVTSLQSGQRRVTFDDYIPVYNTLVQYARSNNFERAGYGVDADNKKYWHRDSEAASGGNWGNHALLQARKHTPQIPEYEMNSIGVNSSITDDASCLFTVELDEKNRMFFKHKQSGLYLSSYAPFLVSKSFAINMDHAACKLYPVLTKERAQYYYQASTKHLQDNRTFIAPFCNYGGSLSNKFPDGTLKIGSGTTLSADPVTAAFEKICACNMDYQFYQNLFCPDQMLRETFGVTDSQQIQTLRGTLKCDIPNCIYPLCKTVFELGANNAVRNERTSPNQDCGASAVCFNNVTVNNNGTLVGNTFNLRNNQQCGNDISGGTVRTADGPPFWLENKKNIITRTLKCTIGGKDIPFNTPFCLPAELYNFSTSTMTPSIRNKKMIYTISNVTGSFDPSPSNSNEIKSMILGKYNLEGLDDYNVIPSSQDKRIVIESKIEIECPAPQTLCEYNPTLKKWFTRNTYTRPADSQLTVEQFNQACASSTPEGCASNNDCTIGTRSVKQACSTSTSEEIFEFPITRLPSGAGRSCEAVVASTLNNASYTVTKVDDNIVRATKICDEDNKWSTTCSTDSNVNRLVQKLTQCIPKGNARCVDKVCIDWPSGATIQNEYIADSADPSKGTRKITVNLTDLDASKLTTTEVTNFIKSRLNINDTMQVTANGKQLIVIVNYNCGTIDKEYEAQCVYENGKWVKKFKNIYKNPTGISGDQFNQSCKPATLAGQEDCKDNKDCEIILNPAASNACVNGKQKIEFAITKNLSGSGKSCLVVAKDKNPDYTFTLDPTNVNKINGEKSCTITNQWENTCIADSNNSNRLLNKIKNCLPANNDECKDKICIDWPSESAISTVYEPLANQGRGKKIVTVTMSNADRNLIQSNAEVRRFIQSKLNTTDSVTYTYDGNKLVITVDYSCGTLEKTYEQECALVNGNWIKRYTQSYKNPTNVDMSKLQELCALANPSGEESCDVNKDCEVLFDSTINATCVNGKQKVGYKLSKPPNKDGKSCEDVLKTIEPSIAFTLQNSLYTGEKTCAMPVQNIDCQVGDWGACSVPCGGGKRTRAIKVNKQGNGKDCGVLEESCNTQACPPPSVDSVDCQVGEWGQCSKPCGGGTRTRPIKVNKQGNGRDCGALEEPCNTQACPPPPAENVDCQVGEWGQCSKPCDSGKRTRPIKVNKQGNGRDCGVLEEPCNTQACPIPPSDRVDCKVGDWGDCTVPCGGGTRTRPILVKKQGTGADCPSTSEPCNTQDCPPPPVNSADCQLTEWSECSKPCGEGTRSRQITVNKQGNGKDCGPLFEKCNTQACEEKKKEEAPPADDSTNKMLMGVIGVMAVVLIGGGVAFAMRKK
jgi:hypothetical protein